MQLCHFALLISNHNVNNMVFLCRTFSISELFRHELRKELMMHLFMLHWSQTVWFNEREDDNEYYDDRVNGVVPE